MSFHTSYAENLKAEKSQVSPLEELLIAFITNPTVSLWGDVNKIKSMSWFDKKTQLEKQINQSKHDLRKQITKKGRLLLLGFSNNLLPNGKEGIDAKDEERNEGSSGITLKSELSEAPYSLGVSKIYLLKYYPTKNYNKILHNQLSDLFKIKLLTNKCEDKNNYFTEIKFYQINYGKYPPIYAKIYLEEEGYRWTPGKTYIDFYRQKPTKNMEEFHCIEIH